MKATGDTEGRGARLFELMNRRPWMVFGLAIGLSVALAIYVKDRSPRNTSPPQMPEPASMTETVPPVIEGNDAVADPEEEEPRFTFYEMLPNFEVVIPEQEPEVKVDTEVVAVAKPGIYVLQAGSFSEFDDADRRRATLALHGIESRVQRVTIDDKTYHRVRIGPIDDLDELNIMRNRLRQAQIEVLRIRLGD